MLISLIIGNFLFAISTVFFWEKLSRLKKSHTEEIQTLNQKLENHSFSIAQDSKALQEKIASESGKLEMALQEITSLKQEKEKLITARSEEMQLRINAEKEIDLTLQKTEDIQRRMHEWKLAQESAIKDSAEAIKEVGEDIYYKLSQQLEEVSEVTKDSLQQILERLEQHDHEIKQQHHILQTKTDAAKPQAPTPQNTPKLNEDLSKSLIAKLAEVIKNSGHPEGEKYFTAANFGAKEAKMFFCEMAFIDNDHIYFIDFKGCNFLNDYVTAANKEEAKVKMLPKLEKYIAYLNNAKYKAAILKALESTVAEFEDSDIVMVTASYAEIEALDQLGELARIEGLGIKVATYDEISELAA